MAINRLKIDGYGQVELNNVAFRRDGRIEAQYKPDGTNFKTAPVENGMILAVDGVNRTVKFAKDGSLPVALVYSTEHIYDERTPGLKNFKLNGTDDFLPRLGYLSKGDKFHTNCVCYDTTEFTAETNLMTSLGQINATPLYGVVEGTTGAIKITKTKPESGLTLLVIEKSTMPDGQLGIKFQVLAD